MPASGAARAKVKGGAIKESDKEKARTKFYSHTHTSQAHPKEAKTPQTRVRTQSESGEGRKRLTRTRSGCSSSEIQHHIARSPAAVLLRRSSGDPAPFTCRGISGAAPWPRGPHRRWDQRPRVVASPTDGRLPRAGGQRSKCCRSGCSGEEERRGLREAGRARRLSLRLGRQRRPCSSSRRPLPPSEKLGFAR